jgi:hypothetical protein
VGLLSVADCLIFFESLPEVTATIFSGFTASRRLIIFAASNFPMHSFIIFFIFYYSFIVLCVSDH